jgi:two-component system LytT family response regulator
MMENAKILRALIVDDEEEARNLLERQLLRLENLEVAGKAAGADEALEMVARYQPDIVFVDVQMPNKDGFWLVRELKNLRTGPTVIFVTAYSEYAMHAIKVAAFDYLLKPVNFDELKATMARYRVEVRDNHFIEKVEKLLGHLDEGEHVTFRTRTSYVVIPLNEIVYCEADVNYTTLFMDKNYKEVVTINIGRMEQILNRPNFYRLGRSHIINLNYLNRIDNRSRTCQLLKNGERYAIKVPHKNLKELLEVL